MAKGKPSTDVPSPGDREEDPCPPPTAAGRHAPVVTRLPPRGQDHEVLGLGVISDGGADDVVDGIVLVHLLHQLHAPVQSPRELHQLLVREQVLTQALLCFSLPQQMSSGHFTPNTTQQRPQEGRKAWPRQTDTHTHTGAHKRTHTMYTCKCKHTQKQMHTRAHTHADTEADSDRYRHLHICGHTCADTDNPLKHTQTHGCLSMSAGACYADV